jgi:hypothetical protein
MKNSAVVDTDIEIEYKETSAVKRWFIKGTDMLHREDGPAMIVSNDDGTTTEHYCRFGRLFRLDGPALINSKIKSYYVNDRLHREDGPAVEIESRKAYCLAGKDFLTKDDYEAFLEQWKEKGRIKVASYVSPSGVPIHIWADLYGETHRRADTDELHREDDEPALVSDMVLNGITQVWSINGQRHRDNDLPAFDGPFGQQWCKEGKLHREGPQPASKMRLLNGSLELKWLKEGKLHREDGPAYMVGPEEDYLDQSKWMANAEVFYYKDGIEYSEKDFYNKSEDSESFSWGSFGGALAVAGLTSLLSNKSKKKEVKVKKEEETQEEVRI